VSGKTGPSTPRGPSGDDSSPEPDSALESSADTAPGRSAYPGPSPAERLHFVQLFTDGACSGNPGPGGWAFILRHPQTGRELEQAGGAPETTNNRMELQAVIEGLATLKKRAEVEIVTDSEYVAKGCREWLSGWKRRGWKTADKKPVKNVEQWTRLDELLQRHVVRFTVVRGHQGHPENERCDELAVRESKSFSPRGPQVAPAD
jgi:ribonuclease HI